MTYHNKYAYTINQWYEILEKAKQRLENSKKCYELFKDESSLHWIKEDEENIRNIEHNISIVTARIENRLPENRPPEFR